MTLSTWLKGPTRQQSWFGALIDGLNAIGSVLIFAIMALICADVLSRNILNQPIKGVAELVAASIVMIVFFQLASALRHGRMAQADIFIAGFTRKYPRLGHGLQTLFYLAGAIMLASFSTARCRSISMPLSGICLWASKAFSPSRSGPFVWWC